MLSKKQLNLLKTLTQLEAISGNENQVAAYLLKTYQKLGYQLVQDNLGSIFAFKKSKNPNAKKVMIAAHMDEVGFVVNNIISNGAIKVLPLGGHNPDALLSSRVRLTTRDNRHYDGLINALPPHLLNKNEPQKNKITEMLFDFGFTSKEDAIEAGVRPGDMIVCLGDFKVINNGKRLLSKAFDDRLGLAAGIEILKYYQNRELDFDLYVGGTVQEEVGLRGAVTASALIKPDLAIVVDCSPAKDSSGDTSSSGVLGDGVLVRVFDSGMIGFKSLIDFQLKVLKRHKIKHQFFISPGGTDAGSIHKSKDGIKTLTFCLVARNIHTPSTLLDAGDYLSLKKGLIALLNSLNSDVIGNL